MASQQSALASVSALLPTACACLLQPEMKGQLMGYFFIGAAMSEALALLGLVLFFIG